MSFLFHDSVTGNIMKRNLSLGCALVIFQCYLFSVIKCNENAPDTPSQFPISHPSPSLIPKRATAPPDFVLNVSYIPTCCSITLGDDLISNEHLLVCIGRMTLLTRNYLLYMPTPTDSATTNSTNNDQNFGNYNDVTIEERKTVTPTVVIVSVLPSNVFNLHSSALAINAAYAEHNKYLYYTMNQPADNSKQRNIITLLKDVAGTFYNGDLVFWLDDDVIVTDMKWRIEEMIPSDDDDIDVFIVQDEMREGLNPFQQNISCIVFRNTGWSLQFFFMFDLYIHYHEEDMLLHKKNYLESFLTTLSPIDMKKVKVLPSSMFHAPYPSHLTHQSHFPLLRLSGEDNMYARSVFEAGWAQICGHTRRHNLHPYPAPFPVTETLVPVDEDVDAEPDRDPLWTYILGNNEEVFRVSTIEDFPFSFPSQLGLNPKALQHLHASYMKKYFEIKNLVIRAKQLKADNGETPLPFRTINQIFLNTITFAETQHPSVVKKSKEDIVFLHLWCYANLRDAFLIPVMNIESDNIESDINDLKAVVIDIFRTLLKVLFRTEKLFGDDDSRKSARQHIISEADKILTSRIKSFFMDNHIREGYYYMFKLLSLQPEIDKKRQAAEYWYYLFEMTSTNEMVDDETFAHSDIDEWIDFFCLLGDMHRKDYHKMKQVHQGDDALYDRDAAAVKYYGTGITLLRSMITRRTTAASNEPPLSSPPPEYHSELTVNRLNLASALLGTVLCSNMPRDSFFTLESKQQLEQAKFTYLNESLQLFDMIDLTTLSLSKKSLKRYKSEYELAKETYESLMSAKSNENQDDMAQPKKKLFKRKKKKRKEYEMINPFH